MTPREQIEWIHADANKLCAERARLPELVYLVATSDCHAMQRERLAHASILDWFEVCTCAGNVEIRSDRWKSEGARPSRVYRCSCARLFLDDSTRSGKCSVCLPPRPFAQGDDLYVDTKAGAVKIAGPSYEQVKAQQVESKLGGLEAWLPTSKPLYKFAEPGAGSADFASMLNEAQRRMLEQQQAMAMKHLAAMLPRDVAVKSVPPKPVDPLDVEYDGITLRVLLERDRQRRTEDPDSAWRSHVRPSPAQRAAVSAHWSAELRAKVKASAERERNTVVVDLEEP